MNLVGKVCICAVLGVALAFAFHRKGPSNEGDDNSPVKPAETFSQGEKVPVPAAIAPAPIAPVVVNAVDETAQSRASASNDQAARIKEQAALLDMIDARAKAAKAAEDSSFAVNKGGQVMAKSSTIITNNDLNKDGIVTKEEATTAGKALIRIWDRYDLNKDGMVDDAEVTKASGL